MKHFYDFIASNKFDEKKISDSNVIVTLKVDGTPLQLGFGDGKLRFYKKGNNQKELGEQITQLDAFVNPAFYPIMTNLYPKIKDNNGKFSGVKILNTEILIENEHHKVQYKTKPSGNLCLINGWTKNDKEIKRDIIEEYADILGVESVPLIFSGSLGEKAARIIDVVKTYCDPHNPKPTPKPFKDEILSILGVQSDSPLFQTTDGTIEGFVFDFGFDSFKLNDPSFLKKMLDDRNKTTEEDSEKIENTIKAIYDYFVSKGFIFKKHSNNEFDNLLQNFDDWAESDANLIDILYENGKACLLGDMLYSKDFSIIPKTYYKYKSNEKFLYAFRLYVWLMGNRKPVKKYPILKRFEEFGK